ncbi:hypothetical protein ST47_g3508 [Ascochyta rabiei]|uniref:Uncharacterized protein n=1 Tax=Didymella rabiei TaxID=5454 RepID=A0A163HM82_DIDRA|nr:hypothetical protein ST47_g3508 [Ascochyta rabiei]
MPVDAVRRRSAPDRSSSILDKEKEGFGQSGTGLAGLAGLAGRVTPAGGVGVTSQQLRALAWLATGQRRGQNQSPGRRRASDAGCCRSSHGVCPSSLHQGGSHAASQHPRQLSMVSGRRDAMPLPTAAAPVLAARVHGESFSRVTSSLDERPNAI